MKVLQLVLGGRCLAKRADQRVPRGRAVRADAQLLANDHQMAPARARAVIAVQDERHAAKACDARDALHQRARSIADWYRSPETLKQLQQDQKAKLCDGSFRRAASEQQLIRGRCKGDGQVMRAEDALEAWIGGVLEARHGAPACQRMSLLWHHSCQAPAFATDDWYAIQPNTSRTPFPMHAQ
jgi:hypothetical protein